MGANAEVFYLHSFGRKETRLLTQQWYGDDLATASSKVDEVLALLGRLNVPRSPFLISALLWIREKHGKFAPVNQAEIIDALIDGVMDKLSESKDRSGLDSTIKRHFLSALAEHLYLSKSRFISGHALDAFTVKYFEEKNLLASSGPFLQVLKARGILLEMGTEVTFMFDCIRAFFLSSRLRDSEQLLSHALSKDGFLSLGEELDYYTGKFRDQARVVRSAISIVKELRKDAALGIELTAFDKISINESPINSKNGEHIRTRVIGSRPSQEKQEEILESIDEQAVPRSVTSVEEVRVRKFDTKISRYMEALRIGSCILRNSELIGLEDDPDFKLNAYRELTDAWCEILIAVLLSVETEDGDRALKVLQGVLPMDNPGMARYFLKILAPNVIMSIALDSLGTEKLQLILEAENETDGPAVKKVLNAFLYADLELPKRFSYFENLLADYPKNRFISELIFFKLMQIFLFKRLGTADEISVRDLLGNVLAVMLSSNNKMQSDKQKSKLLNTLDKARVSDA